MRYTSNDGEWVVEWDHDEQVYTVMKNGKVVTYCYSFRQAKPYLGADYNGPTPY